MEILQKFKLRKRDYILLIIYFYNKDTHFTISIFNNYIKDNHKLETNDIDKLLENKCYNIILLLDEYL